MTVHDQLSLPALPPVLPAAFRLACLLLAAVCTAAAADDLTELPLEELVRQDVVSASRLARQVSDSPAAVAIVTAEDIRAYGYRTLAEVISSMRGLYITYDRNYDYLGGRAFGKTSDFPGNVMLLVDGYATQDNLYNQAYIDHAALVDLAIVERVEYVPGTGSATYGNNALLGIINVVTKRGSDLGGLQLSGEWGSFDTQRQRITYGSRLENGADVLFSASWLTSKGQNFYFPEWNVPPASNGHAIGQDGEKANRLFGKYSDGGLTLEAAYSSRKKVIPAPPVAEIAFNAPYQTWDDNAYFSARHETDLGLHLKSATHLYHGYYADRASRQFAVVEDNEKYRENDNEGVWWGLDQKFVATHWRDHVLVFGAEYRHDYRQHFTRNYLSPARERLRVRTADFGRRTFSLYLTDEYSFHPQWKANLGVRYDVASDVSGHLSPRLALIYTPTPKTTVKASYSEAFRMPSANERRVMEGIAIPEKVRASELVVQHEFSPQTRLTGSLYRYERSSLAYADPVTDEYVNTGRVRSDGAEVELERTWDNGVRLRTSAAWQDARDVDQRSMINMPVWLGKFNLTFPLPACAWRAGLDVQYLGPRPTYSRRELEGVTVASLTLSSERKWYGFSASVSLRNLFDSRYEVPAPGYRLDTLKMDGRNVWFQLQYDL